nr:unnamed protein product [Spirometra erinaceieuropaei]
MTKRAKMAYYAATDDPSPPSTSSLVTESSPEPSMPHLSPEVSIEVPKDPRTPMQTPRACVTESLSNGSYVHLGLKRGLLDELQLRPSALFPKIRVQLHIDGMKLFKGSGQCLWPILGRVSYPVRGLPFVVGVFSGSGKPEPLDVFLGQCISELKDILTSGLQVPDTDAVVRVELANVICDTPARSYVRQVKAHNDYYGCDRLPDGENLPPEIRNLLKEMKQEWACVRKKLDFLSEEMVWVKTHTQDIEAKQADNRRALHAVSFVSKVKPPILQLPLRTAEAYKDFLAKIGSDNELAQETVKHLSTVGGRTEKEFVRNLLTALLGPPLCQTFCWAGSNDKKSFVGSPLFSVLSDAIRCNEQYRSCHSEVIRQTAIEWFHGTRDRYGGRAKRRRVADMVVGVAFELHDTWKTAYTLKKLKDENTEEYQHLKLKLKHKGIFASPFDLLCYVYSYIGMLTGPYYSYRTFNDMLTGWPANAPGVSLDPFYRRLQEAPFFGVAYFFSSYFFSISHVRSPGFQDHGYSYRFGYMMIIFFVYRMRIYFAWLMAECACMAAGLGAYPALSKPQVGEGPTDLRALDEWMTGLNLDSSAERTEEESIDLDSASVDLQDQEALDDFYTFDTVRTVSVWQCLEYDGSTLARQDNISPLSRAAAVPLLCHYVDKCLLAWR